MVREHLSPELKDAGWQLLAISDKLAMQAQGAMWLYDHALEDWRYYIVTSLVDTMGRRKTYRLLLDAFEQVDLPGEMTIEDVHLGSPNDDFFRNLSQFVGNAYCEFHDCMFNNIKLDGVIYRAVRDVPTQRQAERIEKQFTKRVKELPNQTREERSIHV